MGSYQIPPKVANCKDIQLGRLPHTGRYAPPYPTVSILVSLTQHLCAANKFSLRRPLSHGAATEINRRQMLKEQFLFLSRNNSLFKSRAEVAVRMRLVEPAASRFDVVWLIRCLCYLPIIIIIVIINLLYTTPSCFRQLQLTCASARTSF
jgi:hypothetical protein